MVMDALGDGRERRQVALVPKTRFVGRRQVRGWMDFRFLGRDDRPATFCFHAAQVGLCVGITVPHSGTVRDLVEAVTRGDRADLDGFEENIEA
ncbi:hypothetical protein D9M72_351430 [compost metagenome]